MEDHQKLVDQVASMSSTLQQMMEMLQTQARDNKAVSQLMQDQARDNKAVSQEFAKIEQTLVNDEALENTVSEDAQTTKNAVKQVISDVTHSKDDITKLAQEEKATAASVQEIRATDSKLQDDVKHFATDANKAFINLESQANNKIEAMNESTNRIENNMATLEQQVLDAKAENVQLKAYVDSIAAQMDAKAPQPSNQINSGLNKDYVMSTLQRNFPSLILSANSPKLEGCTKRYFDVKLDFNSHMSVTRSSDLEDQIRTFQKLLLSKSVIYSDWTKALIAISDDIIEKKLSDSNGKPVNWSEAMYRLFCNVDFMARNFKLLSELCALQPSNGETFHSYFDKVFTKAYAITEFTSLPCVGMKLHEVLSRPHPTIFTSRILNRYSRLHELETYLKNVLSADAVIPSYADVSPGKTSLFAMNTRTHQPKPRAADAYRCSNCSCTKCTSGDRHLKQGYCVNCHCTKCASRHRIAGDSTKPGTKFRINQLTANNIALPEPVPIFAADSEFDPVHTEDSEDEFNPADFANEEYLSYESNEANEVILHQEGPHVPEVRLNAFEARPYFTPTSNNL